jgi:hypothetical protein
MGSTSYRAPARPSGLTAAELLLDDRSASLTRCGENAAAISMHVRVDEVQCIDAIILSLPVVRLHVQP